MAFSLKTRNAFEMTHRYATREIDATRHRHRAFIAVYPPMPDKGIQQWRVKKFEIPEEKMHTNPYDDDLVDLEFVHLNTIDEVEHLLATWNIDSSKFDAPWKSDYPV
jgi:hypothetical protein